MSVLTYQETATQGVERTKSIKTNACRKKALHRFTWFAASLLMTIMVVNAAWASDQAIEHKTLAYEAETEANIHGAMSEDIDAGDIFVPMNRTILHGGDQAIDILFNTVIAGTGAEETINVADDASIEFAAGNGDRVNLPRSLEEYAITSEGVRVLFEDEDSNRISLSVNGVSTVGFSDGAAALRMVFPSGQMPQIVLGGAVVGSDPLDPSTVSLSDDPQTAIHKAIPMNDDTSPPKNRLSLHGGDQEIDISFHAEIVGTGAKETINVSESTSIRFTAGNGDRVNLPRSLEDYTITSEGIRIIFEDDSGSRITLSVNGASTVGFANGEAALDMVYPGPGQMPYIVLGGAEVGTVPLEHGEVGLVLHKYTLEYTAGENGRIEGDTSQVVLHGDDGSEVSAVPDTDYEFVRWTDGVTSKSRTDRNITQDMAVAAVFDPIQTQDKGAVRVDIEPAVAIGEGAQWRFRDTSDWRDSGETILNVDQGRYWVEFKDIEGWTTPDDIEVVVEKNELLIVTEAYFEFIVYELTYVAGEGGDIDGEGNQSVRQGGDGSEVTAVPEAGYHFVKWDDGITDNPRRDENVTESINVTAIFSKSFEGGDGTEEEPFRVANADQLNRVRDNPGHYFLLTENLDMDGREDWRPIGSIDEPFTGDFDGGGHVVENLLLENDGVAYLGLFGYAEGAAIRNVGIENAEIEGGDNVGGLVGLAADSTIWYCYVNGFISGNDHVGGLVGYASGTTSIVDSYTDCAVGGNDSVGGFVGRLDQASMIENVYAVCSVDGSNYIGGIVGFNEFNEMDDYSNVISSFWNYDIGPTESEGGTGKGSVDMVEMKTFTDAGWDFDEIWRIDEGSSPSLQWQPEPVSISKLNDTGVDFWTDGENFYYESFPEDLKENFPGQDADFGRDALVRRGELDKMGAGAGGFDFTRIMESGEEWGEEDGAWACVRDNHTGLMWEVKTKADTRPDRHLRDTAHTYSWFNPDHETNGGHEGIQDGGNCGGGIECDTNAYVEAVNQLELCGYGDWRLPTREELYSIVHLGVDFPVIDDAFFKNTASTYYWTASAYAGLEDRAWGIHFGFGYTDRLNKIPGDTLSGYRVRLVREAGN